MDGYKLPRDREGEIINFRHYQVHVKMVKIQKVKKGWHYLIQILLQDLFSLVLEDLTLGEDKA